VALLDGWEGLLLSLLVWLAWRRLPLFVGPSGLLWLGGDLLGLDILFRAWRALWHDLHFLKGEGLDVEGEAGVQFLDVFVE